jgi:hypothetical protein
MIFGSMGLQAQTEESPDLTAIDEQMTKLTESASNEMATLERRFEKFQTDLSLGLIPGRSSTYLQFQLGSVTPVLKKLAGAKIKVDEAINLLAESTKEESEANPDTVAIRNSILVSKRRFLAIQARVLAIDKFILLGTLVLEPNSAKFKPAALVEKITSQSAMPFQFRELLESSSEAGPPPDRLIGHASGLADRLFQILLNNPELKEQQEKLKSELGDNAVAKLQGAQNHLGPLWLFKDAAGNTLVSTNRGEIIHHWELFELCDVLSTSAVYSHTLGQEALYRFYLNANSQSSPNVSMLQYAIADFQFMASHHLNQPTTVRWKGDKPTRLPASVEVLAQDAVIAEISLDERGETYTIYREDFSKLIADMPGAYIYHRSWPVSPSQRRTYTPRTLRQRFASAKLVFGDEAVSLGRNGSVLHTVFGQLESPLYRLEFCRREIDPACKWDEELECVVDQERRFSLDALTKAYTWAISYDAEAQLDRDDLGALRFDSEGKIRILDRDGKPICAVVVSLEASQEVETFESFTNDYKDGLYEDYGDRKNAASSGNYDQDHLTS